jgi:hypothetical protein
VDRDLGANAHESSNDNDVGSNALSHGLLSGCHGIVASLMPGIEPGYAPAIRKETRR